MSDRRASAPSKRPVHPKDAASVILLRGSRTDPEVLLGRRRLNARFMPGIYVFPGGRVDRADYRHASSASIRDGVLRKLTRHCPSDRAQRSDLGRPSGNLGGIRPSHRTTGAD